MKVKVKVFIILIGFVFLIEGEKEVSKLYENFHQNILNYEKWHSEKVQSCSKQQKFVIFKAPVQGWGETVRFDEMSMRIINIYSGNRIRNLASAFVASIILKRVILVDWVEPLPLSTFINKRFDWYLEDWIKRCGFLDLKRNYTISTNERFKDDEIILSKDFKEFFNEYDIVVFSFRLSFIDHMKKAPISTFLLKGLSSMSVEHYFYNKILSFQPWIHERIDQVLSKFSPNLTIGLQMRLGSELNPFPYVPISSYNGLHTKKFWLGDEPIPEDYKTKRVVKASPYAPDYFFYCADKILKSIKGSKIFLTSDNLKVIELAKKRYKESLILVEGVPVHSGVQFQNSHIVKEGMLKVLVEWYIIGEVNLLYTTQYSSFGKGGSYRGGNFNSMFIIPRHYNQSCPQINRNHHSISHGVFKNSFF